MKRLKKVLKYMAIGIGSVLSLAALVLWVLDGSAGPSQQTDRAIDDRPYRVYEAVVEGSPLRLMHFVSEQDEINVSSNLIMGKEEIIVFSTQGTKSASERLADEIEKTGLRLTYVYLDHAHADHSQGASVLKERFPNARFVAHPRIAKIQAVRRSDDDTRGKARLGDNAVMSIAFEPLNIDVLMIEGREIQLWHDQYGDVGIGHEDEPHTVAYIPDLKALLPNDIAYYKAHMMMGGSTKASRAEWKKQLQKYKQMDLQVVIPGHTPRYRSYEMTPDGVLDFSLSYLDAYEQVLDRSSTSDEVIAGMRDLYPGMDEHISALTLGSYLQFEEMHKLAFNPRLELVFSYLPTAVIFTINRHLFASTKASLNP